MPSNGKGSCQNTIEDCKEYIKQLYLVQRKTQKQILQDLVATKQLRVTKSQLEYKLRKWNFRRELNQAQWWYVKRKIEHRQRQKKESEVFLSGVPIHQKTIERETARLFLSTLDQIKGITERPKTPENIDLSICTPEASEAGQGALEALRNLPWARLQGLQVARLLHQTCRQSLEHHGNSQAIWLLVSQILEKLSGSLDNAGACRRLGRIATATQSLDRYAAHLGNVITHGSSHEHFEMLSNLRNQNSSSAQFDALRLLIFSVSNNFVMVDDNGTHWVWFPGLIPEDDPKEVLQLFQTTVMNDFSVISRLIEAAETIPAVSIFVKKLFNAAILLDDYDIAAATLCVVHKGSTWTSLLKSRLWKTYQTPLAMAVNHRDIRLTSLLLKAGADPNESHGPAHGPAHGPSLSPLDNASAIDSHDTAFEIASLLVSHGAAIDSRHSIQSLSLAVIRGNFHLIELLVGRGAEFGQVCRDPHPDIIHTSSRPQFLYQTSPEILAAGFCSTKRPSSHTQQEQILRRSELDNQARFVEDQEIACQMVRYMLGQEILPKTSSFCPEKSRIHGSFHPNTMIVAAHFGYHDVIRILHSAGASITALNSGGASPLSAAALRGDVGTCRLLMELNNDYDDTKEFDHGPFSSSCRFPTALQIAAWDDNVELCRELLAHGADPNGPHASRLGNSHYIIHEALPVYATRCGWNCLRMALLRKSAQVARCLLAHRHIHPPNQQDLLLAANLGDMEIMSKILKLKKMEFFDNMRTIRLQNMPSVALGPQRWIHFRSGNEPRELIYSEDTQGAQLDNITALQVAAFEGHTNIVEYLLESSFEIVGAEAACAFRAGPKSLIQLILDRGRGSLHHKTLDGRSYLEMAFLGGHSDLIEFALGLDPTYYDSGALCAAVMMGSDAETVRTLVRRRNCSMTHSNEEEHLLFNTALSLAASRCRRDLVQELLAVALSVGSDRCVVPDRPVKSPETDAEEYLISEIPEIQLDNNWIGWHSSVFRTFSPMFLAVLGQDEVILQDLLTAGYRTDGPTLKAAICVKLSMDLNERLVNSCVHLEDGGGESYTPLQEAIVHGETEWVRLLLQSKADPRACRKGGEHLHNIPGPKDRTAFQLAVEANVQEITEMLIDQGVSVNEPAGAICGMTALQVAARDGLLGVAIRLRALGADVNAHRALQGGQTALEAAAANGRIDLVQYLLDSGVLTTGTARVQYIVAIKLAEKHGHWEISALLEDHRLWTAEDFDLFEKTDIPHWNKYFYHPNEYTDDEREGVLKAIEVLESQRESDDSSVWESEDEWSTDDAEEDSGSICNEGPSHSTEKLGGNTIVTDALLHCSYASRGGSELDGANGFGADAQLVGGSEMPIMPQPGGHMDLEEATYILQDDDEMEWATGVERPLNSGFGVPFFAPEEWSFAFEEFPFPEEQL